MIHNYSYAFSNKTQYYHQWDMQDMENEWYFLILLELRWVATLQDDDGACLSVGQSVTAVIEEVL